MTTDGQPLAQRTCHPLSKFYRLHDIGITLIHHHKYRPSYDQKSAVNQADPISTPIVQKK
jgi:hypothetical protein